MNLINYKLLHGDCLELMKDIPDKSIDMILVDLPYGSTQNKWDVLIPFDKLWEQYNRVCKSNSNIVLSSQGIFTAKLMISNEKYFKYKLVWEKSKSTNFLNVKKQPLRKHEDICVFYKGSPVYNQLKTQGKPYTKGVRKNKNTGSYGDFDPVEVNSVDGLRYPTDVIYFKTAESEGKFHPTQKPVDLMEYLIRTYSNEGETVLDNTMGSGTTGVACGNTKRNFIGIEKDDKYFEIASKRIEEAYKRDNFFD